jgi:hypothetical protein
MNREQWHARAPKAPVGRERSRDEADALIALIDQTARREVERRARREVLESDPGSRIRPVGADL